MILLSAAGWQIYLLEQVRALANQYGYGKVPSELIPSGVETSDAMLWIASIAWYVILLSCTMYCFYQLFRLLRTHFQKEMRYGFGWTVASIFIPVVFLFRPWLGLAEIRKKVGALRFGIEHKFDAYTLFFALVFCFSIISLRLIGIQMEALGKQGIDQSYFATAVNLEMGYAAIAVVVTLVAFLYCRSVIVSAKDAISLPFGNPTGVTVTPPVAAATTAPISPARTEFGFRASDPATFKGGQTTSLQADYRPEQSHQVIVQTENRSSGLSIGHAVLYGLLLSALVVAVQSISLGHLSLANTPQFMGAMAWGPMLFVTVAAIINLARGARLGPSLVALLAVASVAGLVVFAMLGWLDSRPAKYALSDADIGLPTTSNAPTTNSAFSRDQIRASLNSRAEVNGCISKQNAGANSAGTIERYCTCFMSRLGEIITGEEYKKLKLAAAANTAVENLSADVRSTIEAAGQFCAKELLNGRTQVAVGTLQNASTDLGDTSDLSNRATNFLVEVFREWSQPNDYVSSRLGELYSDQVSYYEALKSRSEVMADKLSFTSRWPERSYRLRPGSLSVRCELQPWSECTLEGIVDWRVRSAERGKASAGSANFFYTVALEGTLFKIIAERSSVIKRQAGTVAR